MTVLASVLLAEDDELVRAMLTSILAEMAEVVAVARTGDEALEILRRESFAAVITDLRMPGVSGLEILAEAARQTSTPRVIVISGYADDEVEAQVRALGGVLLHKPFGAARLRQVLLDDLGTVPESGSGE